MALKPNLDGKRMIASEVKVEQQAHRKRLKRQTAELCSQESALVGRC